MLFFNNKILFFQKTQINGLKKTTEKPRWFGFLKKTGFSQP